MLTEHWTAAEADFQQYYGLDLAHEVYGGGRMSARRVTALLLNLPLDSRTMKALDTSATDSQWTIEQQLLGLIVERLDNLQYVTVVQAGGKAKKPKPFVPRPKPRKAEKVDTLDMLSQLDRALEVTG